MKNKSKDCQHNDNGKLSRRKFFRIAAAGSLGAAVMPSTLIAGSARNPIEEEKPSTNIKDALKYERTKWSMPGKFPGSVIKVDHANSIGENGIDATATEQMLTEGMKALTGKESIEEAWLEFVAPGEKIGLKINPVAGKLLSTSIELTQAVVKQLKASGIPAEDIVIWDRREFQMYEAGYDPEDFPGVKFTGTEIKDKNDSFFGEDGKLYSLSRIDEKWYYWADVEQEYDAYTLPYMVNQGKHSYFSKICTEEVDKIINLPILKNAGSSITLCLKNLAYGAVTNTARLHKQLWSETSAEVCAFPPIRDKVVLNIVDGIKGCFDGGPAANPQFITNYKTMLFGSDAVAVDRIGYDIIIKKRILEGLQEEDNPKYQRFMTLANEIGLGESDINKIKVQTIELS